MSVVLENISGFISHELSVGSLFQNIGFYLLFALSIWILVAQFKYKAQMQQFN
jgi:hypothetical protein